MCSSFVVTVVLKSSKYQKKGLLEVLINDGLHEGNYLKMSKTRNFFTENTKKHGSWKKVNLITKLIRRET